MKVKDIKKFFPHRNSYIKFYKENGVSGSFLGVDGLSLHYAKFIQPNNTKAIVISPGRGEAAIKYSEVIFDLHDLGFDIWVLDHRGQGFSQRVLKDPYKGHVNEFDDYVTDFDYFSYLVIAEKEYEKKILLAHSMGAAIALLFHSKKPSFFDGAILSSPMFDVKLNGVPKVLAIGLLFLLKIFGKAKDWVVNGGHHLEEKDFKSNTVTNCERRYGFEQFLEKKYPRIKAGVVTNNWVLEAILATDELYEVRKKIKLKTLIFQASEEHYVNHDRQDEFCEHLDDFTFIRLENARHEVLQERNEIRDIVMTEIFRFLKHY